MTAHWVILLRHSVTDWNEAGRFQGHTDIPLSESGLDLARRTAAVLAGYGITRLISSDLARARQTAAAVAEVCGLETEVDPRLREVDVGSWSGMDLETVGALVPEFWPALREGRDFRRSPEGETATESGQRVAEAILEQVAASGDDDVLLVVGHGLSLRVATLLLLGLDYSYARLLGGLANCGWLELRPPEPKSGRADAPRDHWRLSAYNRTISLPSRG